LLTGYFHEKATKAVSDAYWKARYEAIYGNMSAIMDKLSDEECAFILSQLNCNQMNAYKMMVDIADQMDIVRTFIKTKQDAIELARKMPDIVYLERHKEGMQKGYDGARLQNYIYFPHLLWDGKIINFDEWLTNYPNRLKSCEGTKTFASAKHCYSVETSMNLINDDFILLDSDVLLCRDITPIANNKYLFCGTIEKQWKYYRVCPYLLYINVNECRRLNIHFFDDEHMHGLCGKNDGDNYDTGSWFYEKNKKLPHKTINISDYIIHYKGASWEKTHNDRESSNGVIKNRELKTPSSVWMDDNRILWEDYQYNTQDIKQYIHKELPVLLSLTTWKNRIKYLPSFFENLKKQIVRPDACFLWLSSDELTLDDIPPKLLEDDFVKIVWVDKNLKSFKKFLTIQQCPNAYNIVIDDDRNYSPNMVGELLDASHKYGDECIIDYYCDNCNSKGQPWGGVQSEDNTGINWINDSCILYPPHTFPMEAFTYFYETTLGMKMISDECFLMPFIIYDNCKVINLHGNMSALDRVSPIISGTQNEDALHVKFYGTPNNQVRLNKKNQLIWDICSKLPLKYKKRYMETFPNFGCDVNCTNNEKIIVTLTTWKLRIGNMPVVLTSILNNTKKPHKIILNLSSEEFPQKEQELPNEVIRFFEEHNDICEIHWVDGPNYKNWKKTLPTLKRYPNDCIVNIDDDFIYPNDMIETLWKSHLDNPNNPISGNNVIVNGMHCQCGCASLVKLEYLDNIFNYATDEVKKMNSDDVFFSYVAKKCGHEFVYCGKEFFTNMPSFNETLPLHTTDERIHGNPVLEMYNYMINKYGGFNRITQTKIIGKVNNVKILQPTRTQQKVVIRRRNGINGNTIPQKRINRSLATFLM